MPSTGCTLTAVPKSVATTVRCGVTCLMIWIISMGSHCGLLKLGTAPYMNSPM